MGKARNGTASFFGHVVFRRLGIKYLTADMYLPPLQAPHSLRQFDNLACFFISLSESCQQTREVATTTPPVKDLLPLKLAHVSHGNEVLTLVSKNHY